MFIQYEYITDKNVVIPDQKMLEMQYALIDFVHDLEKIAEMGEQIRGVVEEILPTDNGTTAINAFLA